VNVDGASSGPLSVRDDGLGDPIIASAAVASEGSVSYPDTTPPATCKLTCTSALAHAAAGTGEPPEAGLANPNDPNFDDEEEGSCARRLNNTSRRPSKEVTSLGFSFRDTTAEKSSGSRVIKVSSESSAFPEGTNTNPLECRAGDGGVLIVGDFQGKVFVRVLGFIVAS
jgi:hypothetical protein